MYEYFIFILRRSCVYARASNPDTCTHGLINYIDTIAKCRHLNNWPVKGICGMRLSEFMDWIYYQSCWYFRPSFVNYCPSPSLWFNSPSPYTYTVCKVWGSEPQTNKHLPRRKVPLQVIFFRWRHFAKPSMSLNFLRMYAWKKLDIIIILIVIHTSSLKYSWGLACPWPWLLTLMWQKWSSLNSATQIITKFWSKCLFKRYYDEKIKG
jgi:hypothetical protein